MDNHTIITGDGGAASASAGFHGSLARSFAELDPLHEGNLSDRGVDQLFEQACRSAAEAGGQLLFELPATIFDEDDARVAVLRHGSNEQELCFVVLRGGAPHIRIVSGEEAPGSVFDFALAYAAVLQLIASDEGISRGLPH